MFTNSTEPLNSDSGTYGYGGNTVASGETAFVDDEDVHKVSSYRWHLHSEGYAVATKGDHSHRENIWMHVLVSGITKPDHRNGNKLDNRKSNLRAATDSFNMANQKIRSTPKTSIFKGVCWDKRLSKWRALIKSKPTGMRSQKELGRFADEIEAAKAYNRAAIELFGEFARLNPV